MNKEAIISTLESFSSVTSLTKDILEEINNILYSIKYSRVDIQFYKEYLSVYKEKLSLIPSDHTKSKNITLFYIDRIINPTVVEDLSENISQRQRKFISSLVKEVLLRKRVLSTSISKEYFDLLIYYRDIGDITNYNNTLESISKNIFKYNTLSVSTISSPGCSGTPGPGPLRGGGLDHLLQDEKTPLKSNTSIDKVLSLLEEYETSFYLLNNTYVNINTLSTRIATFLIHLHYSDASGDNYVPIPREFLEQRGYEYLTSAKLYTLDEEGVEDSSIYFLQRLGFIKVLPARKNTCRRVALTKLGEAIVAGLSLFHKKTYPIKEIPLRPGDLTYDYRDLSYYYREENFYPDKEKVNAFLDILGHSKIDITSYINKYGELYPIVKMSREEYKDYFSNTLIIDTARLEIEDFSVLRNFDRDLNLICTGQEIQKLSSRTTTLSYQNIWRLSYTGRFFQRQGFQGITRKSKDIVHKNGINYDIPSSQLRILIQYIEELYTLYKDEFTEQDLEDYNNLSNLKLYVDSKDHRESVIREIGISSEEWKKCVYSMVYGTNIHNLGVKTALGSVVFFNATNPSFDKELFLLHIHRFYSPISLWFRYVRKYTETLEMNALRSAKFSNQFRRHSLDPKDYLFNGVNYTSRDYLLSLNEAQMSSYFFQGMESAFILSLMTNLPDLVISYEFDGLVVEEEVPLEIIEEARRQSGFKVGDVIVKPFL